MQHGLKHELGPREMLSKQKASTIEPQDLRLVPGTELQKLSSDSTTCHGVKSCPPQKKTYMLKITQNFENMP